MILCTRHRTPHDDRRAAVAVVIGNALRASPQQPLRLVKPAVAQRPPQRADAGAFPDIHGIALSAKPMQRNG
ncbi:hypothetical protein WT23_01755 [Burkholderia territorii]|nr:hypothetical protein WT23_01755 [Burkholderia territorii]